MEDAQFYTWSTRCKLKQDEKMIIFFKVIKITKINNTQDLQEDHLAMVHPLCWWKTTTFQGERVRKRKTASMKMSVFSSADEILQVLDQVQCKIISYSFQNAKRF